ncbi:MAG: response regulator [bacterium]|nr:response regulator [bacterium]
MRSTILVIDDEPLNLKVISNILKNEEEYYLLYAPGAKVGLEIAKKHAIDAIIMDWDMPDMNGIEATSRFKENTRTKDVPIIIATGKVATPNDLVIALGAGATDFLRKPIVDSELVARLTSALQISRSFKVIKEQNNAMKTSLKYAQEIQEAMLPKSEEFNQYFSDHFILEMTKEGVRGDIYWLRSNLQGKVLLVLIDSGPSVGGALISIMINLQLQRIIEHQGFLQAHEILKEIYRHLYGELGVKSEATGSNVKVSVCLFDVQDETIQYAGSQTNLFLWKDEGELVEFVGDGRQEDDGELGVNQPPMKSYKFRYSKGYRLYLLTDGLETQHGGEFYEMYGCDRVKDIIKEISTAGFSEQQDKLRNEFKRWIGNSSSKQNDDFIAVGIQM